jgi:hypothetical protein
MDLSSLFRRYKCRELSGRYIHPESIAGLLGKLAARFQVTAIGASVQNRPIHYIKAGHGAASVLMWSQMHGNESTTTKAVFDMLSWLAGNDPEAGQMLSQLTLHIVPMLNPDGALAYTRENASGIDLNRDFCARSQPETRILLELYERIKPDYCFNLHDQRTIYGAGFSGKPATISFLAPSTNERRDFNDARLRSVWVIAAANDALQELIPGQVARFDDGYNPNCAGDTFQSRNTPTVLFEAGHFPGDYQREATRKLVFVALLAALRAISGNAVVVNRLDDYLNIPQNTISFFDIVYKNVKINYDGKENLTNFGVQFREVLDHGKIAFKAEISETGLSNAISGHSTIDAAGAAFRNEKGSYPHVGSPADFYLGTEKYINGESQSTANSQNQPT